MKRIRKVLDFVTSAMLLIASAGLFSMMVNVTLDVTLKYLFDQPVPGTLEMVSFYFMATSVFLPFAYVEKTQGHIVMTLGTDWLSPRSLRYVVAAASVVGAAYLALFAWASAGEALRMTGVGESTDAIYFEILIWPSRWCVPLGVGVMACWMLLRAVVTLGGDGDE